MVSPKGSTPHISHAGFTPTPTGPANIDANAQANTARNISSTKKSQELTASRQEGLIKNTPQKGREIWSPHSAITGQVFILSVAESMHKVLTTYSAEHLENIVIQLPVPDRDYEPFQSDKEPPNPLSKLWIIN